MAHQKENSYRLLWMLGLALTLPMILASGPIAGYLIAYLLTKQFDMPQLAIPILMGLGLIGSAIHATHLIQRIYRSQQTKGK